jgi:hypothetical protein
MWQGYNCAYPQCTLAFDQVSTAGGSAGASQCTTTGVGGMQHCTLGRGLTTTLHLVVQEVCIAWLMQASGQFWLILYVWQQAVRTSSCTL